MKALQLLDEIVKILSSLGPNPSVSESLNAFQKAEETLQDALDARFNDGYEHRKKCEIQEKIKNQQKFN